MKAAHFPEGGRLLGLELYNFLHITSSDATIGRCWALNILTFQKTLFVS